MNVQAVAERLKILRVSKKLTVREVEGLTRLTAGNISCWENGRYLPSATALVSLSKLYEVSVDWILTGTEGKLPSPEITPDPELTAMIDYMKEMWQCGRDRQGWLKIQFNEAFPKFTEWLKAQLKINSKNTE